MGELCGMNKRYEICTGSFSAKLEGDNLEYLGKDGRIMLKWSLWKQADWV